MPLIVIVFEAHTADTPGGRLVAEPIPVAPVLVCVMGVRVVLADSIGVEEAAPTIGASKTVIVPVALALPAPPVNGMA
jgi:hypothetical protein